MGIDEEFQKIIAGLFESRRPAQDADERPLTHLRQPATRAGVEELFDRGYLSGTALVAARGYLDQPLAWWRWISRMLLLVGSALVLAGVVFFFAYNWNDLGRLPRFAVIEVGLTACIVVALFCDLDELPGKVLVTAASVLTGVLLLVYGQTYNTGVDSASLYILWASFIFAWVAIAEFDVLWVGWLMLVNTAIGLYWFQHTVVDEPGFVRLLIALSLLDGFMLVIREYVSIHLGLEWLRAIWVRRVLLAAILVFLTVPAWRLMGLLTRDFDGKAYYVTAALLLLSIWVAGYRYCRFYERDLGSLTLITISVCVVLIALTGAVLELTNSGFAGLIFLRGTLVAGVFAFAVVWLKRINRSMAGEENV